MLSPSSWYDDGIVFEVEERTADGRRGTSARTFMGVGSREINEEHDIVADLRRMAGRASAGRSTRTRPTTRSFPGC